MSDNALPSITFLEREAAEKIVSESEDWTRVVEAYGKPFPARLLSKERTLLLMNPAVGMCGVWNHEKGFMESVGYSLGECRVNGWLPPVKKPAYEYDSDETQQSNQRAD